MQHILYTALFTGLMYTGSMVAYYLPGYTIDIRDGSKRAGTFEGACEEAHYLDVPQCLEYIARFIPENPIIFEAGSHDGDDTLKMAHQWPKGKIFAFEPYKPIYRRLVRATKNRKNIETYQVAVNDYNGFANFYVANKHLGANSLLKPNDVYEKTYDYHKQKAKVPCVILDDWCREKRIDHIDFMWLDLEGVELQVLKSSPRILQTVKVIYTETNLFDMRENNTLVDDLKNFLMNEGFVMAAHWYWDKLCGNALFIRKELL